MPTMKETMHEYKEGELHSGSKTGPKVTNRKQAIAIGLNQEREMGGRKPMKPRRGMAMK